MDSKTRYSLPFIMALTLHLVILALFALSSLIKFGKKAQSVPEIMHARVVENSPGKAEPQPSLEPENEPFQESEPLTELQKQAAAIAQAEAARAKAAAEKAAAKKAAEEAARAKAAAEKAAAKKAAEEAARAKAAAEYAKARAAALEAELKKAISAIRNKVNQ
ncbi:MAG: cell envelope integrity protein TolA, partial [Gammaproteobacteria bacterium]